MKRTGLLVTGIALLAAAFLVLPSLNPAQAQVPDTTTPGTGYAWCHGDDGDATWDIMQDHMGGAWGGHMGDWGAGYMGQVELGRVARVLGISTSELVTKLQGGESLAQVAQGYGVTEEQLVNTLVEPYQARLAVQVQYGYLTQEEADELLSLARERAQTTISATNVLPSSSAGSTGSGTGYGPGGMMGGYGGGTGYGSGGMMGGTGSGTGYGSGGMMGGYGSGTGYGSGGMMGGYGSGTGYGSGGMMGGYGSGTGYGSGGMMGGTGSGTGYGSGGGMMGRWF